MSIRKKESFLSKIYRAEFCNEGLLNLAFLSSLVLLGFGTLHQAVIVAQDYVHTVKTTAIAQASKIEKTLDNIDYATTGSIHKNQRLNPCAIDNHE